MNLREMLYEYLSTSEELSRVLATYDGQSAVFCQHAPPSDDALWSKNQYPRIDYTVDMREDSAHNSSGELKCGVWCDAERGASPEDIEAILKKLLHAAFAQAEDCVYCFAWARSDAFEQNTLEAQKTQTARTIGVTVIFYVSACPSQASIYPDPINALSAWTKSTLPGAIVLGLDEMQTWTVPTKENPVIYWQLTRVTLARRSFSCMWLDAHVEGHVYGASCEDRLYNLLRLGAAQVLSPHITMEDGSPMFLRDYSCDPNRENALQCRISAVAQFGVTRPDEYLKRAGTGENLLNAFISCERSNYD